MAEEGEIVRCLGDGELDECVAFLQEHLIKQRRDKQSTVGLMKQALNEGLRLVSMRKEFKGQKEMVGVVGYRTRNMIYTGKVLFISEFVIHPAFLEQSNVSSALLQWIIREAGKLKCNSIEINEDCPNAELHRALFAAKFQISDFYFTSKL